MTIQDMIMWHVVHSRHSVELCRVTVERANAKTVWIDGNTYRRSTRDDSYFDTFAEAKNEAVRYARVRVDAAEAMLARIEATIEHV